MQNYAELMFTGAVRAEQERIGSRKTYAASYPKRTQDALGDDDRAFIETRTSFYMATVSETGWPYIQHRGGPRGFLKVLGDTTLGFSDYRGNRQLISKGYLSKNDWVSLFLIDYPRRARLKMQGHARMVQAGDAPDLALALQMEGEGRVERLVTIDIVAMDWNCPQFITPRFDQEEIAALLAPEMERLQTRIADLEAENAALRRTD